MMRSNVVLPYRFIRPSSDAVKAGGWYRSDPSGVDTQWLTHGSGIEDWSYDSPLFIGREIEIDSDPFLSELDLDEDAEFELVHTAAISALGIRTQLHSVAFRPVADEKVALPFWKQLDSYALCEEINFSSVIVLRQDLKSTPPWSPHRQGTVCWADDTRIPLEGLGSRFPMREIPFSKHFKLPENASWHIDWRPGLLHYSFNSAVTLLLNSEQKDFFKRMQENDEVLVEQVMGAIIVEICGFLIGNEDFVSGDDDYSDGSLGSVARSWLQQSMPGMTLLEIQHEYRRSPSTVHTALRTLAAGI